MKSSFNYLEKLKKDESCEEDIKNVSKAVWLKPEELLCRKSYTYIRT